MPTLAAASLLVAGIVPPFEERSWRWSVEVVVVVAIVGVLAVIQVRRRRSRLQHPDRR